MSLFLLWTLYTLTLFNGSGSFHNKFERTRLYGKETGTIYGINYDTSNDPYLCNGFAGTSGWEGVDFNCTIADFDVLGYTLYKNSDEIRNIIADSINNREAARFPIFNNNSIVDVSNEFAEVIELLQSAINKMGEVFAEIAGATCKIMSDHAPKFLAENIKSIVYNVLPFCIMGWY